MFILYDIDIWRQHNNISSFKFTIIIIVLIYTKHHAQDPIYLLFIYCLFLNNEMKPTILDYDQMMP